jgi:hypothetical protein
MKTAALAGFFSAGIALGNAGTFAQTITVTRDTCAQLTHYVPSADVEYRPGQDVVDGEKVVPADLDGTPPIEMPESFTIPISVNVVKALGLNIKPELDQPDLLVGTVSYRDGRFYFNDQPLQSDAEAELAALCQKVHPR